MNVDTLLALQSSVDASDSHFSLQLYYCKFPNWNDLDGGPPKVDTNLHEAVMENVLPLMLASLAHDALRAGGCAEQV